MEINYKSNRNMKSNGNHIEINQKSNRNKKHQTTNQIEIKQKANRIQIDMYEIKQK